ncbi:hypothetical protein B0H10DRAFT_1950697 [Mycena sp. CBHHK59/15]|nr:hypothetical protein B0H10DRAFT_1950697 [Mycena sp. CBHHK59/15]
MIEFGYTDVEKTSAPSSTNDLHPANHDFYTSLHSNIVGAREQDALVSRVGTPGSGLTRSGCIFVNPLIARAADIQHITFAVAALMSLGLFLASYCSTLYGVHEGGYNALLPMTISEIYGVEHYAGLTGAAYFVAVLGSLRALIYFVTT